MILSNYSKLFFALVILSSTPSCLPVTAASTAVVGTSIVDERSAGDILNDNVIELKVKEAYLQEETSEMFHRISVNAIEGRVLLTGSVTDQQYKDKAEDLAWDIKGVKEVINEIEVTNKELSDHAKDLFIASTIRSRLLFEQDLCSVNYVVDVNRGIVYLLGIAQDQDELGRALKIASSVKGVYKVVNHVLLKDDSRRNIAAENKKKET